MFINNFGINSIGHYLCHPHFAHLIRPTKMEACFHFFSLPVILIVDSKFGFTFCTLKLSALNGAFVCFVHDMVVSGSKPGTSFSASPFPAEIMLLTISHESATIVPSILSPSKQQNRESLISKPSHGGEEIRTPVLLLPSQIFPSIAEGNTHALFQRAGELVLCKNEGSLSADSELVSQENNLKISKGAGKDKCHPGTINRLGWHFVFKY